MVPVLEFIFASFWRWLGVVILVAVFAQAIAQTVTITWRAR